MKASSPTVAGIDVGGTRKGFHAVALREERIVATLATSVPGEVVAWCRELHVSAVGVDAPCRWSHTGRARVCERELAGLGMSCFSTPSQIVGEVHPFYRWMVNGAELFRLLPLPFLNIGAIGNQVAPQSEDQHQHMFRH